MPSTPAVAGGLVVAVVNPARRHAQLVEQLLPELCREADAQLEVLHTSPQSPGRTQALRAAAQGAARVVVVGGDGTVRQVASGLAGSPVAMGIIPSGTADLFALNLGMRRRPRGAEAAVEQDLRHVLAREPSVHDVGRLEWTDAEDGVRRDDVFLVVAGLGEDAATVAATSEGLKGRAGWLAYPVRGAGRLRAPAHQVRLSLDEEPARQLPAWSVLIGSAPRIPAGIPVFPGTSTDSGSFEVLRAHAQSLPDWAQIGWRGLTRRPHGARGLDYRRARTVEVTPQEPLPLQVDGDVLGRAAWIRAVIDPSDLLVVAPAARRRPRPLAP